VLSQALLYKEDIKPALLVNKDGVRPTSQFSRTMIAMTASKIRNNTGVPWWMEFTSEYTERVNLTKYLALLKQPLH